jgi:hypothetical protein
MNKTKPFWKSNGFWGSLVMLGALAAQGLGLVDQVAPTEQTELVEGIMQVIAAAGGVWALIGRLAAKKKVTLRCLVIFLMLGLMAGASGCSSLGDNVLGGEAVNTGPTIKEYDQAGRVIKETSGGNKTDASLFVEKQAAQNIAMLVNQKPTWELVAAKGQDITMSGVEAIRVYNSSMTPRQLQQLKTWYMALFGEGGPAALQALVNGWQSHNITEGGKALFAAGVSRTHINGVKITGTGGSAAGMTVGSGTVTGAGSQPTTQTDDHRRITTITNEPAEGQ